MNKKYKIILVLLVVIFAISSYLFLKEFAENKKENDIYENLQEIVQDEEKTTNEIENTDNLKNETSNLSTEKQTDGLSTLFCTIFIRTLFYIQLALNNQVNYVF